MANLFDQKTLEVQNYLPQKQISMKSKRNKAQDNQTPAALPLANTKASSLTNEPKHKIEAEDSSSKDDDIEMDSSGKYILIQDREQVKKQDG